MKFGRTYKMTIFGQYSPSAWTIIFPTTLVLDVQRNTFSSANVGTFTLKNLSKSMRRDIFFDRYAQPKLRMRLQAGYVGQNPLPTIFQGYIRQAWTQRQGVEWLTNIEAFDGGLAFYSAMVENFALPKNYTMKSAASALIAKMAPFGVQKGAISEIALPNSRNIVFTGTVWDSVKKLVPGDGQCFVDNGVANILNPQDYIATPTIPTISAETGLIGTPRKIGNITTCTTIFDPQYIVGQLAALNSRETWMNAPRLKVVGLHHYGKISGTEGGDLLTDLSLFSGYANTQLTPAGNSFEGQVA